ncbi:class A sortase [Clostridium perfringens]|uniref:class A sortase n=1 Tax=Clostridium perfringens TaxID=1502 RepID=UPI0018ABE24B|nr:class A sortase [Clostridium perfringens]WEV16216.1 class A sortase [Clostridium perfringens D]EHK2407445.1 class A sortase [Clostridium perfringens]EIF2088012.1 class A sortase [Clostridium perfringens]EJT6154664.1 class A sortase [Clostridium perfringens]ELC8417139.1 class A sortase [Clostridium perfringens]
MKIKESKTRRYLINILLVTMAIIGIILILNDQIKDYFIKRNSRKYSVENLEINDIKKNKEMPASFDFDNVKEIDSKSVFMEQYKNKELPAIGGIAIPSVGINLPIFKGLSNEALIYGAGTMSKDQVMGKGNYSLASHHTKNPELLFTPLEKVKVGEKIYLTDLENIYVYDITSNQKVSPDSVHVLDEIPGKNIVTLVTCGESEGITRIVVQGDLISITPLNKSTQDMKNAFNIDSKTY